MRLQLSKAEAEITLRALRKYRSTLPIYLQASQEEVQILDNLAERITKKLSSFSQD